MTTTKLQDEVINSLRKHMEGSAPAKEKKPKEELPELKKEFKAKKGQKMYSEVFGYVPSFGDFPVSVLPDNADEDVRRLVPTIDPDYVVQKEEAALLVAGLMDGDKTMMTGPTGSGKSSLCKFVAAKLNWPFIRINMSGDVESSAIFGSLTAHDGATHWNDGAITEACKYGAICLIDEWELMPAEIGMGMQNLLEDGGYAYLKEKPGTSKDRTVIPDSNFRLIYAGNTVGQGDSSGKFTGVAVQNSATIDRFTSTVELGYLEKDHEVSIITSKTSVPKSVATSMVTFAHLCRKAYEAGKLSLTVSPRTLINWSRKCERFGIENALNVAYTKKLQDDEKAAVNEFYKKVFG